MFFFFEITSRFSTPQSPRKNEAHIYRNIHSPPCGRYFGPGPQRGLHNLRLLPGKTPNIPVASSTALASALHAIQISWVDSPQQISVFQAIYSAPPDSLRESVSKEDYAGVTGEELYTKNVPPSAQSALSAYAEAVLSAASSVVGPQVTLTSNDGGKGDEDGDGGRG
ncbi:hypothetical protein BJ875DRAFT_540046 [Amylocarpus encephaloides]|uniref:Uncharacterized protein n=1 Tax=Amylocarpus encephaloides TaxID=45428 RepID=A0A9P7YQ73_9HELO|nr:hypothetical protein BJ875DRAFT_540046 [Amylocarpus encephaloides]